MKFNLLKKSVYFMKINKYINYLMIIFVFIFPLSTAGANIILGLIFVLWILEGNFKEKINNLKKDKIFLSLLGISVSIFISTIFSNSYTKGFLISSGIKNEFDFIFRYLLWSDVLYVIFTTSIKKEYLDKLISSFLIAMFINELISYSVFFNLIDIQYFKKLGLLYKDIYPNNPSPMEHSFYSVYLAITILLLLNQFLKKNENILLKIGIFLFLTSATINLFMNGGRTGQLAIILGFSIYMITYFKANIKYIFFSFVILIGILISAYYVSPIFKQRMNQSKNSLVIIYKNQNFCSSWGQRVGMNIVGFNYLFENPKNFIFGGFAGEAKENYLKYGNNHYKTIFHCFQYQQHLHNQYLQLWMDGGIFAFILILYLFYNLLVIKTEIPSLQYAIIIVMMFAFISDIFLYRSRTVYLVLFIIGIIHNYSIKYTKKEL